MEEWGGGGKNDIVPLIGKIIYFLHKNNDHIN